MLALLLHKLVQLLVSLVPVGVDLLARLGLASGLGGDHDDRGGPLCAAGGAQLGARGQEDVGDVVVLAEHGNVADDVHGGDVGGQDDDAAGQGVGGRGWVAGGGLAHGFYDFLDTALEAFLLGGCEEVVLAVVCVCVCVGELGEG